MSCIGRGSRLSRKGEGVPKKRESNKKGGSYPSLHYEKTLKFLGFLLGANALSYSLGLLGLELWLEMLLNVNCNPNPNFRGAWKYISAFYFPTVKLCFSWNFQGPGNSRQNKDFTPRNSEKLCCTPLRNFKTSIQPRSLKIPHDFFLIIPKFHIVFNWTLKIPFRLTISSILLEIPYPQPPSLPPFVFFWNNILSFKNNRGWVFLA